MAAPSNKKEPPAEPFKRVLGLCVRALAGDSEVQVTYAPGKPQIEDKLVQLPEPSRVPSREEIAVVRGWADSLALTAACHDQKLHNRLSLENARAKRARLIGKIGESFTVDKSRISLQNGYEILCAVKNAVFQG